MKIKDFLKRTDKCIYCLDFPNGKSYVGKTSNLGNRIRLYLRNIEGKENSGKVAEAIKQFGVDNVELRVLSSINVSDKTDLELCLSIMELRYIRELNTLFPNGYNVSLGGESLRIPPEYITTDAEAIKAFKVGCKAVLVYDLDGGFISEYESSSRMDYEMGFCCKDYSLYLDKKKPISDKYYIRSKRYNVIPKQIEVPKLEIKERIKYKDIIEERKVVRERIVKESPALAYDVNGDFVGEYKSRAEACRLLTGLHKMDWGKYYRGYILFKKTNDDYPKKIESQLEFRGKAMGEEYKSPKDLSILPILKKQNVLKNDFPIHQFTLDGEYIQTFPSIRYAAHQLEGELSYSQIYACVKGKTRRAGQYIWQKADE